MSRKLNCRGIIAVVTSFLAACGGSKTADNLREPGREEVEFNSSASLAGGPISGKIVAGSFVALGPSEPIIMPVEAVPHPDRLNVKFECAKGGFLGERLNSPLMCGGFKIKDIRLALVPRENAKLPGNLFAVIEMLSRAKLEPVGKHPNTVGASRRLVVGFLGYVKSPAVYLLVIEHRGSIWFSFIEVSNSVVAPTPTPTPSLIPDLTPVRGMVPLRVIYQAGDTADPIQWTGTFVFKARKADYSSKDFEILTASRNQTAVRDVAGVCKCGEKNAFLVTIDADRQMSLGDWQAAKIAMLSRTRPPVLSRQDDLPNWVKKKEADFSYGMHTIIFGGFDHVLFGHNTDGPWQNDGGWENNDDFKAIFSCKIDECPDGGPRTELEFIGTVFQ